MFDKEEPWDEKQTAAYLGVKPGTLQVWRSTGRYGLPYMKVGGNVRYDPPDVREWRKKRRRTHTGKPKSAA